MEVAISCIHTPTSSGSMRQSSPGAKILNLRRKEFGATATALTIRNNLHKMHQQIARTAKKCSIRETCSDVRNLATVEIPMQGGCISYLLGRRMRFSISLLGKWMKSLEQPRTTQPHMFHISFSTTYGVLYLYK